MTARQTFCCSITPAQIISATDPARNIRAILERVAFGDEAVAIERKNALFAKLVPTQPTMTDPQALPLPMLTAEQAAAWLADY